MKYGLIGEKLGHSFSKIIHGMLSDYSYELCEVAKEDLDGFLVAREFNAINVTIPYKEAVIPHLYYIDEAAKDIGAVNTVVNRGGKLYGYNTDFYGLSELISHVGVTLSGRKVAILGTGGTSKTAVAVAKSLNAREILCVSRSPRDGSIGYGELAKEHTDLDVIINTTPAGMYPRCYDEPIDISVFPTLSAVVDVVYNPLKTPLVRSALSRGIAAEGGLYMLVAQGVRASEIFLGTKYPEGTVERVYKQLKAQRENIVLIGMPASGKSTVGAILADLLGRELIDTDELVERGQGVKISEIFSTRGEAYFRDLESEAVKEASAVGGRIIATGGGAVLRGENIDALRANGKIYFIDRPLSELVPTESRPLSSDRASIEKRYNERYGIYSSACDVRIAVAGDARSVAADIMENFEK